MPERKLVLVKPARRGDLWGCWADGHPNSADTRDMAIFYAGWWAGRRELLEQVSTLVSRGESARVVTPDEDGAA